jgi:hypothetical protein
MGDPSGPPSSASNVVRGERRPLLSDVSVGEVMIMSPPVHVVVLVKPFHPNGAFQNKLLNKYNR